MTLYCCFLAVAASFYIAGEFLHVDMSVFAGATRQQSFISSTVMILLTMAFLPLSLRLFKFKRIDADLKERRAPALLRWGSIRIAVLGTLLVVNTFLYYAFAFESAYGYLAVVTLLCLPFVLPTRERCESEVEEVISKEEISEEVEDAISEEEDEEANDSNSQL